MIHEKNQYKNIKKKLKKNNISIRYNKRRIYYECNRKYNNTSNDNRG